MSRANLVRVVLFVIALCALGSTPAIAYRVYRAPCGDPAGLPGLLLKLHFIPRGQCTIASGGGCSNPGGQCTSTPLSGPAVSGTCQALTGGGCTCVATR